MHEQSYIIDNIRKIPGIFDMNVNNDNLSVNRSHCKLITEAGRLRRIYVGIETNIIIMMLLLLLLLYHYLLLQVTRRGQRAGRSASTGPTSPPRWTTSAARAWGTTTCAGGEGNTQLSLKRSFAKLKFHNHGEGYTFFSKIKWCLICILIC